MISNSSGCSSGVLTTISSGGISSSIGISSRSLTTSSSCMISNSSSALTTTSSSCTISNSSGFSSGLLGITPSCFTSTLYNSGEIFNSDLVSGSKIISLVGFSPTWYFSLYFSNGKVLVLGLETLFLSNNIPAMTIAIMMTITITTISKVNLGSL